MLNWSRRSIWSFTGFDGLAQASSSAGFSGTKIDPDRYEVLLIHLSCAGQNTRVELPASAVETPSPYQSALSRVMKILTYVLLMSFSATAMAQVYKCDEGGRSIYQQLPCSEKGRSVDLKAGQPDASTVLDAQHRASKEQAEAAEREAERSRNQRQGDYDRQQRQSAKEAASLRCANLLRDADKAEKEVEYWFSTKYRQRYIDEAKALRDLHFTECFSRGIK